MSLSKTQRAALERFALPIGQRRGNRFARLIPARTCQTLASRGLLAIVDGAWSTTEAGRKALAPESVLATTKTTTHDDGSFKRTALIVHPEGTGGSIDLVTAGGQRLAQINVFYNPCDDDAHACLMVDVIDVDNRYSARRALVFSPKERAQLEVPPGGNLVGVDFRGAPHRPPCGHSVCSQNFIDTGEAVCVQPGEDGGAS